ncbi:MAG TPA: four helix bundle protein, partial [Verrucomicrobiae bacterium]|nr:four helix bundle protein [Verrucomicrobiae bacterium]
WDYGTFPDSRFEAGLGSGGSRVRMLVQFILTFPRLKPVSLAMRDYTKIAAWKASDDLTVAIYEKTKDFPREELYGLTSQIRRASLSVPANIAEGASRNSRKDYLHFLYIARGSLSETHYFIHLAHRLRYLTADTAADLQQRVRITFGRLHGLIRAVNADSDFPIPPSHNPDPKSHSPIVR